MKLAHSIQVATAATAGHGDTGREEGRGRGRDGEREGVLAAGEACDVGV